MQKILNNIDSIFSHASSFLSQYDTGEVYIEQTEGISISLKDNLVQRIFNTNSHGFSVRGVKGNNTSFRSYSSINPDHILNALGSGKGARFLGISSSNTKLLEIPSTKNIVDFLSAVCNYMKESPIVTSIVVSLEIQNKEVIIINKKGIVFDRRPLWSLTIWNSLSNGTENYQDFSRRSDLNIMYKRWREIAEKMKKSNENINNAKPFEGGLLPVIIGSGNATLLHEAVGHCLEADCISQGVSCFSMKDGKFNSPIVASPIVTVIDSGYMEDRNGCLLRGSTTFDDEGNYTKENILIKNGVLNTCLSDERNAKILNIESTSSARRESYSFKPYPRMNNTFMKQGKTSMKDMIKTIDKGILALSFSNGEVEIGSGQFSFNGQEVFLVENGKVSYPIKGCNFSGMAKEILQNIKMVGNDFAFDESGGFCVKNEQYIPISLGQPSMLISQMTVSC